jgi:hypothetical protein
MSAESWFILIGSICGLIVVISTELNKRKYKK